MADKNKQKKAVAKPVSKGTSKIPIKRDKPDVKWWVMAGIVFVISILFFARSINNEYALDDGIVMEKNEYVHQGISGIGSIMTKDAYDSFFKQLGSKGQLSGGRYRPLSIVTYALEYELLGFKPGDQISVTGLDGKTYQGKIKSITAGGEVTYSTKEKGDGKSLITGLHQFKTLAHTQHFINVLLYAISMVVLFYFLSQVLLQKWNHTYYWALFITLVFAMHPIHSEVVANIKSRDEILSLLFILLTLIQFDKFLKNADLKSGIITSFYFFLAMLSKEYGIVLFFILPVWTWMQQKKVGFILMAKSILPLIAAFIPYMLLRFGTGMSKAVKDPNPDVLNDPYLFATGTQKIATEIYVLLKYFLLQLFPYPLVSDYSFNTIAYREFGSPEVMASVLLHILLVGGLGYVIYKRNWMLSFAGLFYFLNLGLISNFIFDIGATMGERLVYHSSLGLVIAIFYGIYQASEKAKNEKSGIVAGGLVVVIVAFPFFMINQERCAAWKNDFTLARTDVKIHPNSALLNANACAYTINNAELFENKDKSQQMIQEGKDFITKALTIHPRLANGWINLAVIEIKLKHYPEAFVAIGKLKEIFPSHPKVTVLQDMVSNEYINLGFEKYKEGKIDTCFMYLYQGKIVAPQNPEAYYNLGGAYLSVANNKDSAKYYFEQTLRLDPNHQQALQGLNSLR